MVQIKPVQLKNINIDDAFFGNIKISADKNDQTLTIFDKNSIEYIITIDDNGKLVILK